MRKLKEKLNMPRLKRSVTVILIVVLLTSWTHLTISLNPKFNPHELDLKSSGTRSAQILETTHFEVSYNEGKEIFAQMVGNIAENIYNDVVQFTNYSPETKLSIDILECPHFECWLNTGDNDGINIVFQSEWTIDWASGHGNNLRPIIAHELHHAFLCKKLNLINLQYGTLPWWYYDGLAEYFSDQYSGYRHLASYPITIKYYIDLDDLKMLDEMVEWAGKTGMYGYAEGYSVFKFIEEQYGNETLRLFFENSEKNQSVQEGIVNTFKLTQNQFQNEWLDWLYNNFTKDVVVNATEYGQPLTNTTDYKVKIPTSWYNGKILYISDKHGTYEIFSVNENGTNIQRLTNNYYIVDSDAKWSPDGSKILFTSNRGTNYGVYIMDSDGSNVTTLIDDQHVNLAGSWSPDENKILFVSDRMGNYDIFSVNIDGSEITQLTTDAGSDGDPIFSPNGDKIIFISNRTGRFELFKMNNDGANVEQLTFFTHDFANVDTPYWSPNGKKVIFEVQHSPYAWFIYMMDLSELEPKIIIEPLANNTYTNIRLPVWSEDVNEIIFASSGEIYRHEVFEISEKEFDYFVPAIAITIIGLIIVGSVIILKKRKSLPPSGR